ncbi:MAG: NAD(P)-dependent glycerol-1-phosphate dehydrogenase [Methanobrevibacter sp.]|uniref:NAD(P)-dependent glycerol-1-phosphate dehydrogenase n=1 Tax=Methanobrevibacter sp. TaxID=66852 RepID=UPI0026DFC2C3|nr:NAD(P)-dependent glycerol-1-phosphate dehydrogenase [Methanobrevibacter sp.]MDO5849052.1 NAD(P)-dependent glycerol-1-phosphate dehydrogenase [Methanobrevibacter sp.]
MDSRVIQMPREVHIGPGVVHDTGNICDGLKLDKKILIVTGQKTYDIGARFAIDSLQQNDYDVEVAKVTEASFESVGQVEDLIDENTTVIGVGGGTVIDVAKLSSSNKGVYFISMPTTASHDGIVSPLASIKGANNSTSLKAHAPIAVIGDSEIISKSPFRLLAAGCADLISNFTAIKDWQLAKRLKNVPYSESAASLSIMSAKMITNNIESIKPNLEESARVVLKTLFSSSTAISIAGSSRPASGSEHKFSHALDLILDKPALHGEQCGIGTILMMKVYGGDWKFIRNNLKAIGAPTNAKELGVCEDDIIEALTKAHTIRPERYTILGEKGISEDAAHELAISTGVI